MSYMTMYKTVKVTNPRNVLVQIPSFIAGAEWNLKEGDNLAVLYDDRAREVTIRPAVQRRGDSIEESNGMAGTTET